MILLVDHVVHAIPVNEQILLKIFRLITIRILKCDIREIYRRLVLFLTELLYHRMPEIIRCIF